MRRVRELWRVARQLPGIRRALEVVDRWWWARVISAADVVDLDYARSQRPVRTKRSAIRVYVRGAHRDGFGLNPLFVDRLVGLQLSEAHRVPPMYAYLVNDVRAVATSSVWDSISYAMQHPESLSAPGGPMGHAWRSVRDGVSSLLLGSGADVAPVPWSDIHALARRSHRTEPSAKPVDIPAGTSHIVVSRVGEREAEPSAALDAAIALSSISDSVVVIAIDRCVLGPERRDAELATLWRPNIHVRSDNRDWSSYFESVAKPGTVVAVRGPDAEISISDLMAMTRAARHGAVAPLWLLPDSTVAAAGWVTHAGREYPLLSGHPSEDARALGEEVLPAAIAGDTFALPVGRPITPPRTLTHLTVRADGHPRARDARAPLGETDLDALLQPAGLRVAAWKVDGPRYERVLTQGGRRLRWAIRTAAPGGRAGEAWGDTHFARGIADALRRLGQEVVIDTYAARHRPSRYLDDVVLALRGPERIEPQEGTCSLLWIISHPDQITSDELHGFDRVFAGSSSWAHRASRLFGKEVRPLLQCTDTARFHPTGRVRTDELIFVGTARGIARPSVVEPLRAGIPISVYGPDWRGYIPGSAIKATGIPNRDLPAVYESARAVLNDHWPAMQANGFVSNRLYDVVAAGGRAISDHVEGIEEIFQGSVITYRSIPELLDLLRSNLNTRFPSEEALARIAADIANRHSFDARARTLLDAALAAN